MYFSKTWNFIKVLSYIRISHFHQAPLMDGEVKQGQYYCTVDLLFEGHHNDLNNQAFCILRVPFVIVVGKTGFREDSRLFKPDMLNPVEIIKSPMDFLIEQNYPQNNPDDE